MGYVFSLIAAALFGTNGSVTKVVVEGGLSPAQLTFFRVLSATVISDIAPAAEKFGLHGTGAR